MPAIMVLTVKTSLRKTMPKIVENKGKKSVINEAKAKEGDFCRPVTYKISAITNQRMPAKINGSEVLKVNPPSSDLKKKIRIGRKIKMLVIAITALTKRG